jgi:ribosomal protein S18 acetylase RimI-like enzyme
VPDLVLRPLAEDDQPWLWDLLVREWGLPVVTPTRAYHAPERLPGLVAERAGELVGAITWNDEGGDREVVTLNAVRPREGVGRALLGEVRSLASGAGMNRVWLITTDDNPGGVAFYDALGMARVRVLRNFHEVVAEAKPGHEGDYDAIEFEWRLG